MPRIKNDFASILTRLNGSVWYIRPEALDMMLDILSRRVSGEVTDRGELHALLADAALTHDRQHGDGDIVRGVGVIPVYGPIFPKANMMTEMSGATSLDSFKGQLQSFIDNEYVSTIVLDVDSPGGSADLVPETAAMIRNARAIKPIVAVANTAMNSAAYYLGSQASAIYASPSAQVGSIGVINVHRDESRANEMAGIKETFTYAGKYKSEGYEPLTYEAQAHIQDFVNQHYDEFVSAVATGRGVEADVVEQTYGQGRVFTATDALNKGMIDGIASFDQVLGRLIESGGDIRGIEAPPVPVSATGSITVSASVDTDKEHSEPGTGLGGEPAPRLPRPEDGDPMIEFGWRRDTPPIVKELEEEESVNRQWLEDRATALGIEFSDETADDDLAAFVEERIDEIVVPLADATAEAQKQQDWARAYPEQASQLATLLEKDRRNEAHRFADSYRRLPDDGTRGYSTLVREKLEDAHIAITERQFSHADLEDLVSAMSAKAAIVPLGEQGSSRENDSEVVGVTRDFVQDRKAFAELVRQAMTDDNMTQAAAIAHVSEANPELAQAYLSGHVGR